jgi:hypothetical protein
MASNPKWRASMGTVTILRRKKRYPEMTTEQSKPVDWVTVAAGSALVIGGLLFLSEKRRAGLALAAAGSALAVIGEEETLRKWWAQFPVVVDQVQSLVSQVQSKVSEFAAKRDSLHEVLSGVVGDRE